MSCGLADWERRAILRAEHGTPAGFPGTATALRLLGVRDRIHPNDAVAFVYRDQAAADAFAASNAAHCDLPSLGTVPVDGGVLGALDLRPALARGGLPGTAPARPDNWKPP
jgi:hypothetical protein